MNRTEALLQKRYSSGVIGTKMVAKECLESTTSICKKTRTGKITPLDEKDSYGGRLYNISEVVRYIKQEEVY